MRRAALILGLLAACAIGAQSAYGYFTGILAASATAGATSLLPGATPTVVVAGRAATVTWTATGFASGGVASGYTVVRFSEAAPTVAVAPANGCSGLVAATTCTETGLPAGAWRYAIVPRAGSAWTGPQGSASAAATIAPPSLVLAQTTVGGPLPRAVAGTLAGFDPLEALVFRLDSATTGTLLAATPSTATAQGGAAVSVTVPATTEGVHTIHVVGANGTQASASILVDTTPPTTTDSTAALGSAWTAQPRTVVLTATDGVGGSGVAATYATSNGTTPTTASPQDTSVALTADGVFTVRYFSVDAAGNSEAVRTAGTAIRIDRTAPTPGALATPGAAVVGGSTVIANGQTLTNVATDPTVNGASSGVASIAYYACPGSCTPNPGGGGTTLIGTSTTGPSYSVTWSGQPADGTYSMLARVSDVAGTASDSAVITRVVDNTGPVVTATLADAQANQAGYINRRDTFYAYANVVDAGIGANTGSVVADLSVQCGSNCGAIPLSSAGGPFTVLTASGTTTYQYRSALVTSKNSTSGAFSVRAADALGTIGSFSGTIAVDILGSVTAPTAVTLTSGSAATGFASCAITANGYINAASAGASTVTVALGSSAPAGGVVVLTATAGTTSLTFRSVVPAAGAQTVAFSDLALSALGDGTVALSALEYSPGGNAVSSARTQSVAKLTATPAVNIGALVYTDNVSPAADRVSSTTAAGPAGGYLSFTQTAGTRIGTAYVSAVLSGTGGLSTLDLAAESTSPTYAVAAVDAACNPSTAATWKPTAVR